jgi:DNA-binding CsgD family transcriptional regulator
VNDHLVLRALGLTAREAEVLYSVAAGKTNPEVGIILGIRRYTVRTHLERVFMKLGVENRLSASLRALKLLWGRFKA